MTAQLPLHKTYRKQLSQTELFRGLPESLLDDMLSRFRLETWRHGSVHDSDIALRRFFIVISGRMELLQAHPFTGKQIAISMLREGDVYDVLSLLDDEAHPMIPIAIDDLQLLSAPVPEVRSWISSHPEFNANFLPYLARRIRQREALAADLGLYNTETRLARTILRCIELDDAAQKGSDGEYEVTLLNGLSNEKLAQMVGAARQVINRHLQQFKREGVLHQDAHRLIIDDLEKLHAHAEDLHLQFREDDN